MHSILQLAPVVEKQEGEIKGTLKTALEMVATQEEEWYDVRAREELERAKMEFSGMEPTLRS